MPTVKCDLKDMVAGVVKPCRVKAKARILIRRDGQEKYACNGHKGLGQVLAELKDGKWIEKK